MNMAFPKFVVRFGQHLQFILKDKLEFAPGIESEKPFVLVLITERRERGGEDLI